MPKTKITYSSVGDYLIPDLTVQPQTDFRPIGIWGERHRRYLMEKRKCVYSIMSMDNSLHTYPANINEQAEEMFYNLVKAMAAEEGITEQLKAENQTEWVRRMNNVRNRAGEIVNSELIYN